MPRLVLLLLLVSALHAAPVRAAEPPRPTALVLEVPNAVAVGERFTIVARLTGPSGELYGAVENEALQLLIDGRHYRRERTNYAGAAQFVVTDVLSVGEHTVTALYRGSNSLQPAAASAILVIAPAVLEIETVPALPGITVRTPETTVVTGPDGIARVPFHEPGTYRIEIEREQVLPSLHARFARWNDDWFSPDRLVTVPKQRHLQAGYDTETIVSYRFVDLDGRPVEPERIERIVLKSSVGEVRELPGRVADDAARTVKASRAIPTHAGLVATPVQWSVEAVYVRGTNVVNRNQQRFYPMDQREWTVTLLLYDASFSVRDVFFGLPVGRAVELTYPDGTRERVPLRNGRGSAHSLPRGDYRVRALGILGWSPSSPLALSRDQSADLTVISGLDLLALGVLAIALLLALVLAGRPHLSQLAARLRRTTGPIASPTLGRTRRLALAALLATALAGTVLLTQGLARSERPAVTASTTTTRPAPAKPTPVTRTETSTEASPTPPPPPGSLAIAPELLAFWQANGGLAVFGQPTAPATWTVAEDGTHVLAQDFTLARLEYAPSHEDTPYRIQLARIGAWEARTLQLLSSEPFQRRSPDAPPGTDCTYFTQTGHWLCSSFRAFWRRNGLDLGDPGISPRESLALLGYPISEAFVDEFGRTVQYFERAKLVSYPDYRGTPNEIVRDPIVWRNP